MALTITVIISDADQVALENDLLDIDDWVQKAVIGKINNCKKRMAQAASLALKSDDAVASMPASDDGLIAELTRRPDYKNRAQRELARAAADH
tara:strand:+ start:4056 stop:4334 length:279 start_codon:yes stop_codon:yes gene_type:complete